MTLFFPTLSGSLRSHSLNLQAVEEPRAMPQEIKCELKMLLMVVSVCIGMHLALEGVSTHSLAERMKNMEYLIAISAAISVSGALLFMTYVWRDWPASIPACAGSE
jgi:hypothetical protein